MIKHNFDQTPILLENFDQVIRSSEIRSSDPLSDRIKGLDRSAHNRKSGLNTVYIEMEKIKKRRK